MKNEPAHKKIYLPYPFKLKSNCIVHNPLSEFKVETYDKHDMSANYMKTTTAHEKKNVYPLNTSAIEIQFSFVLKCYKQTTG